MITVIFVMSILGLIEVLFYIATGKIPERTPAVVILNAITWAGISMWAIYLILSAR